MKPASYWPVLAMTVAETVGATVSVPANEAAVVRVLEPWLALEVNRARDSETVDPRRLPASTAVTAIAIALGREATDRVRGRPGFPFSVAGATWSELLE